MKAQDYCGNFLYQISRLIKELKQLWRGTKNRIQGRAKTEFRNRPAYMKI